jgi:hypothetical protein
MTMEAKKEVTGIINVLRNMGKSHFTARDNSNRRRECKSHVGVKRWNRNRKGNRKARH